MRAVLLLALVCCGRKVWQAPDPNTRSEALQAVADAPGQAGLFAVKTPKGQWIYARERDSSMRVSVAQARAAYVSTVLLQLVDQGKLELSDPVATYVSNASEGSVRALLHQPWEVATMQQVIRVAGGEPWQDIAARYIVSSLRLANTEVTSDDVQTAIADLLTFGRALGEGALLTAQTHGERFAFEPLDGYDGYGLGLGSLHNLVGHLGDGCAVFHDPAAEVTIAIFASGDPAALTAQLYQTLR